MKKVDVVVTKQNDVDVIRYELGAADVYDNKAADKATGLPNVVPFQYSDEDGKRTITSYVKEKMTLEAMYKRTMNKKQVLSILSGLVSIFEIGTQGIPVSYIIKEPSYIYVNEETLAVKCVLVAVKQDVMPLAEIPAFFRDVVSRIMYDDSDRDNYVARLLTAINSNDFTVSRLKSIVDEQLEAMGLFVSKENGLTDMPGNGVQAAQAPAQIKVNKLGVMNNIQNANRQAQMQNMPPMGQAMPQAGQPLMGQPMPQAGQTMGQPMPQAGQTMGQPMPQAGQTMGQPQPQSQPMSKSGQPPMGQPMPQAGQPPMGQPMPQAGQTMGQPQSQPMPKPGQPPMGQPMPQAGQTMGQPQPQPMPKPGQPPMGQPMPQAGQTMGQPQSQPMPKPGQPPMGQPMPQAGQTMGQPQPQPMPKPGQPPMGQPMPQAGQTMGQPQPQPMPKPGQPPMGQAMPQAGQTMGQPQPQPKPGQPPMGQPMPQAGQTMGQPQSQPMPKPGQPPMGQPMPQAGQTMGQPQPQPMPKPGQPQPMPKPGMPPMGQAMPQAGQPQPMPKPGMPPMGQPMPQAGQPQPMPKPGMPPMGQAMPQPSVSPQPQPMETTHGNLVGQMGSKPIPHIVRKKTGEVINITKPEFSIGKSKTKADYAIEDNSAISRVHCIIVQKDGVNYIKDNNSTNHTYLNGVELAPGKEQLLKNKTLIQMGDEEFTFFLRKSE